MVASKELVVAASLILFIVLAGNAYADGIISCVDSDGGNWVTGNSTIQGTVSYSSGRFGVSYQTHARTRARSPSTRAAGRESTPGR